MTIELSSTITLKQLHVFCAVANCGSITLAADKLFVTKAAVSIALNTLEQQLGQPLFDRIKNRLVLNTQGLTLLPLADELLQRMNRIGTLFSENKFAGTLNIGASVTIGNHLLPNMLAGFLGEVDCQRPLLKIENTACLAADLLAYQLDIAFVEGHIYDDALEVIPWLNDEMHIIASTHTRLPSRLTTKLHNHEYIKNDELEDLPWVLREVNSGTREQFNQQLAPHIHKWRIGLELNSNEAVVNAVAAGIGLGFMSNLSVADAVDNGRLIALKRQQPCTRQLSIVLLKNRYISPLLQCFIEYSKNWQPALD